MPEAAYELELEDLGHGQTKYTARALYWTAEDKKKHEEMGFQQGWGETIDRLVAVATAK